MAYLYKVFGSTYAGGVALPTYEGSQPIGSGAVPSSMVELPGGNAWDSLQSNTAHPRHETITVSGEWIAASTTAMETKLDALKALRGTRSLLWATIDGGTTNRWRYARCLDVRDTAIPGAGNYAVIEMDFELVAGNWNGAAHALESTTLDTSPHDVATTNGGNARVRDAIITIRAVTTDITVIGVSLYGKVDWHWTGTLAVGKDLIINCGTKRVTNDGADAYAGLVLQTAHADADWLPLDAGLSTFSVHLTGGASSTFKLTYNDGWA